MSGGGKRTRTDAVENKTFMLTTLLLGAMYMTKEFFVKRVHKIRGKSNANNNDRRNNIPSDSAYVEMSTLEKRHVGPNKVAPASNVDSAAIVGNSQDSAYVDMSTMKQEPVVGPDYFIPTKVDNNISTVAPKEGNLSNFERNDDTNATNKVSNSDGINNDPFDVCINDENAAVPSNDKKHDESNALYSNDFIDNKASNNIVTHEEPSANVVSQPHGETTDDHFDNCTNEDTGTPNEEFPTNTISEHDRIEDLSQDHKLNELGEKLTKDSKNME